MPCAYPEYPLLATILSIFSGADLSKPSIDEKNRFSYAVRLPQVLNEFLFIFRKEKRIVLQLSRPCSVYLIMKTKTLLITTLATLPFTGFTFAKGQDRKGCKISEEKKAELLTEFDKDGDGKLSKGERKAAKEARKAAFIEKNDTDGDGKLSKGERKAAHEAKKAEILAKFDEDGDGELNEEERQAAREANPRHHKKGRHKKIGNKGKGKRGDKKGQANDESEDSE